MRCIHSYKVEPSGRRGLAIFEPMAHSLKRSSLELSDYMISHFDAILSSCTV